METDHLNFPQKPLSVLHDLADHFFRDALDFGTRFDQLWEAGLLMHKMGRTKSFVDLMIGCECALKAHCFLSHLEDDPEVVYREVRRRGHNIDQLAAYATLISDRSDYEALNTNLARFSVFLRYSIDAYETFFPSYQERELAELNYSRTIGNNAWVLDIRACLERLNAALSDRLGGWVTDDLEAILTHEKRMMDFADACIRGSGRAVRGARPGRGEDAVAASPRGA